MGNGPSQEEVDKVPYRIFSIRCRELQYDANIFGLIHHGVVGQLYHNNDNIRFNFSAYALLSTCDLISEI